jgi:hypothetical protein
MASKPDVIQKVLSLLQTWAAENDGDLGKYLRTKYPCAVSKELLAAEMETMIKAQVAKVLRCGVQPIIEAAVGTIVAAS